MLFLISIYLYGSLLLQFGKVEARYLEEASLFHIFTQAKQKNRGEKREEKKIASKPEVGVEYNS